MKAGIAFIGAAGQKNLCAVIKTAHQLHTAKPILLRRADLLQPDRRAVAAVSSSAIRSVFQDRRCSCQLPRASSVISAGTVNRVGSSMARKYMGQSLCLKSGLYRPGSPGVPAKWGIRDKKATGPQAAIWRAGQNPLPAGPSQPTRSCSVI